MLPIYFPQALHIRWCAVLMDIMIIPVLPPPYSPSSVLFHLCWVGDLLTLDVLFDHADGRTGQLYYSAYKVTFFMTLA